MKIISLFLIWVALISGGCAEKRICDLPEGIEDLSKVPELSEVTGYYKLTNITLERGFESESYLMLKSENGNHRISVSPFPWCVNSSSVSGSFDIQQSGPGMFDENEVSLKASFILPDRVVTSERTFFLKKQGDELVILVPISESFIENESCWQILDSYIASCHFAVFQKVPEGEVPLFPFRGK